MEVGILTGPIDERVHWFWLKLPDPSVDQDIVPILGFAPAEVSVTFAVQILGVPTPVGDEHFTDKIVEWPVVTLWVTVAP